MARRSQCPISFALDVLGDRWTLLVVRDLALKGKSSFSELMASDEAIASNILTERLSRLEAHGVVVVARDHNDRRRKVYRLTEAGKDLLPILLDMLVWGAAHDAHVSPTAQRLARAAADNRDGVLQQLRARLDNNTPAHLCQVTAQVLQAVNEHEPLS